MTGPDTTNCHPKNKFLYLCSGDVVWVICMGCADFSLCKQADESSGAVGGGDYAGGSSLLADSEQQ